MMINMEEKVIIKGKRKDAMKVAIIPPIISVVLFLGYLIYSVNSYRVYYSGGYLRQERPLAEAIQMSISSDALLPFIALIILIGIVVGYCIYRNWSKVEITVTNLRVFGVDTKGKRVDLPLDKISSVAILSSGDGVAVSTASGAVEFRMIENCADVRRVIAELLVARQHRPASAAPVAPVAPAVPTAPVTPPVSKPASAYTNADELRKYKELLDMGAITQEEYDAKKKQLLGL